MSGFLKQWRARARATQSRVALDLGGDVSGAVRDIESWTDGPHFVEVTHAKPEEWTSLIHLARHDDDAYDLIVALARKGYFVFRAPEFGSRFVAREEVGAVWAAIRDATYKVSADGIVYRYEDCRSEGPPSSLVVVFANVAKNRFSQKLDRHFPQVFETLRKSVGGHTAILRIADMDGVVGGFYLPTARDPQVDRKIQALILQVAGALDIPRDRIVTYGPSKGGTGALFHGLALGLHTVAVDPIVTNNRRRTRRDDPYFGSSDIFIESRDDTFESLLTGHRGDDSTLHVLMTSRGSQEFPDVVGLAQRHPEAGLSVIESRDPHITAHHEVAPNTVALTLAMINSCAQGLPLRLADYTVVD